MERTLAAETAITLTSQFHDVNSVAFNPDGKRIVCGSNDETLKIWDGRPRETDEDK